jgi:transcriptional regulator with XRE-family HTH domain
MDGSNPLSASRPASRLGTDLRALRRSRGTTLVALAAQVDRSVGWLSQVERGLSDPSIDDLRRLASTFGVPMGFFFQNDDAPADERDHVVRAANRRVLGDPVAGLVEEMLSPDLGGAFEMLRSTFAPGAELAEAQVRDTEEAGYVISGTLDLWVGERLFTLMPGDSFRFAGEPYRWRNPGTEEAVVIWTITPPVY